jgi:hypothetical protein
MPKIHKNDIERHTFYNNKCQPHFLFSFVALFPFHLHIPSAAQKRCEREKERAKEMERRIEEKSCKQRRKIYECLIICVCVTEITI